MENITRIEPSKFDKSYAKFIMADGGFDALSEKLRRSHSWLPLLQFEDQTPEEAYRGLKKKRQELRDQRIGLQKQFAQNDLDRIRKVGKPENFRFESKPFPVPIDLVHTPIRTSSHIQVEGLECEVLEGTLSTTHGLVSYIETPDDNDTDHSSIVEMLTAGGSDKIIHKSIIDDETARFYWDEPEWYIYWAVLGYELPAPACKSRVEWGSLVRHNTGIYGGADYKRSYTEWLRFPKHSDDKYITDPTTLADFDRIPGYQSTNVTQSPVFDCFNMGLMGPTDWGVMLGDYVAEQGQKTKVWFGLYIALGAEDGRAVNGWSHLYANSGTGANIFPGISYRMIPI